MKNLIRNLVLAPAVLCATAAFAADTSTVNVPFSFTAHGKSYPAGKYVVAFNANGRMATLSSKTETSTSISGMLTPSDGNPNIAATVRLEFSSAGADHELRRIKYGVLSTADLASHSRNADAEVAANLPTRAPSGR